MTLLLITRLKLIQVQSKNCLDSSNIINIPIILDIEYASCSFLQGHVRLLTVFHQCHQVHPGQLNFDIYTYSSMAAYRFKVYAAGPCIWQTLKTVTMHS